jgi:N-acyl-D-aspartate/D-glutamate deacylase
MSTPLIKKGLIIDGNGLEPFRGNALADDERIAAVIRSASAEAGALLAKGDDKTIYNDWLVVSHGFIGAHSRFDRIAPRPEHEDVLLIKHKKPRPDTGGFLWRKR